MERMVAAAGVDVSAAQDNDAWLLPIPATLIVGRDGVIPRMGIEDMLAALRALIAVLVQAIVKLPESGPTGASMRGVWPPRNTLLPSNSDGRRIEPILLVHDARETIGGQRIFVRDLADRGGRNAALCHQRGGLRHGK